MATGPRTLALHKNSVDDFLGLKLTDGPNSTVRIADIQNPELTKHVSKGDLLHSINGEACQQGSEHAAGRLRDAIGQFYIEITTPPSGGRSAARNLSTRGSVCSDAAASQSNMEHTPAHAMAMEGPFTLPFADPDGLASGPAADFAAAAPPRDRVVSMPGSAPGSAPNGPWHHFRATLSPTPHRASALGVRLMMRGPNEPPMVVDIDPLGPAAHTGIHVGDALLDVNGVDARLPATELKAAVVSGHAPAVLTLRRPQFGHEQHDLVSTPQTATLSIEPARFPPRPPAAATAASRPPPRDRCLASGVPLLTFLFVRSHDGSGSHCTLMCR